MTLKYKEYMDKIEISEEMKSRILSNIEEFEKKSNSNNKSDKIVRPFFKKKVYKGLTLVACFAGLSGGAAQRRPGISASGTSGVNSVIILLLLKTDQR